MLHEGEPPELPAELEGGEDGVLAGEGDQRGRGQRAVRVDPRPRVPEAVLVPRDGALFTAASERDRGYCDNVRSVARRMAKYSQKHEGK